MIPRTIHYCWFGGKKKPKLAKKCINSWKRHCPEFEIKEWNESNYDITQKPPYVQEAFRAKKWAFVSDFARFDILYQYGGVYFDTDVEVIKPIIDIVDEGPFMGCEKDGIESSFDSIEVAPGLGLAANVGLSVYKDILDYYSNEHFINADGSYNYTTVVKRTTELLKKHGLQDASKIQVVSGITIYPKEYFCPLDFDTRILRISDKTYSIHHYAGTWIPKEDLKQYKIVLRKQKLDRIKHIPNRVIKKIVGGDKYSKIKMKLK